MATMQLLMVDSHSSATQAPKVQTAALSSDKRLDALPSSKVVSIAEEMGQEGIDFKLDANSQLNDSLPSIVDEGECDESLHAATRAKWYKRLRDSLKLTELRGLRRLDRACRPPLGGMEH